MMAEGNHWTLFSREGLNGDDHREGPAQSYLSDGGLHDSSTLMGVIYDGGDLMSLKVVEEASGLRLIEMSSYRRDSMVATRILQMPRRRVLGRQAGHPPEFYS